MIARHWVCLAVATVLLTACSRHEGQGSSEPTPSASGSAAGTLAESDPTRQQDAGSWTMAPGDYASTRFSRLDEINTGNVKGMKVAWTFSTGMVAGHAAAPLVGSAAGRDQSRSCRTPPTI